MEQAAVDAFSQWAFATQAASSSLAGRDSQRGVDSEVSAGGDAGVSRHRAAGGHGRRQLKRPTRLRPRPDGGGTLAECRRSLSAATPPTPRRARSRSSTPKWTTCPTTLPLPSSGATPRRCGISRQWNNQTMAGFDNFAKMSQFGALWRAFTCGQLEKLFAEYATQNLPQMIRQPSGPGMPLGDLQQYYCFVGVVYWKKAAGAGAADFRQSHLRRLGGVCRGAPLHSRAAAGVAAGRRRRRRPPADADRRSARRFPDPSGKPVPRARGRRRRGGRVDGRPRAPADGMGPVRSTLDVPVGAGRRCRPWRRSCRPRRRSPAPAARASRRRTSAALANKTWNRSTSIKDWTFANHRKRMRGSPSPSGRGPG